MSSSSSEESSFAHAEKRRRKELIDMIQPLNAESSKHDLLKADATPVSVDKSISWDSIGGLKDHVLALKEMIVLPLLYPEVFQQLNVTPPRGVLFVGPPGTGKTLVARALCNSCSIVCI